MPSSEIISSDSVVSQVEPPAKKLKSDDKIGTRDLCLFLYFCHRIAI